MATDDRAKQTAWRMERKPEYVPHIRARARVAIGGLSESGKSTTAQHLHHRHGFARLKIGYLFGLAAVRHRIGDITRLPPASRPSCWPTSSTATPPPTTFSSGSPSSPCTAAM